MIASPGSLCKVSAERGCIQRWLLQSKPRSWTPEQLQMEKSGHLEIVSSLYTFKLCVISTPSN